MKVALIAAAGALGALSRYALEGVVSRRVTGAFPLGTFVVNVSGCFVVGLVFVALTERFVVQPAVRTAITVGFLGAYTTFSTFALQSMRLAEDGALGVAAANVVASVVAGIAAVYAGAWIGRAL